MSSNLKVRVQIHELKNHLIYEQGFFSKYGIILKYRVYLRFYLIEIKSILANLGSEKKF